VVIFLKPININFLFVSDLRCKDKYYFDTLFSKMAKIFHFNIR